MHKTNMIAYYFGSNTLKLTWLLVVVLFFMTGIGHANDLALSDKKKESNAIVLTVIDSFLEMHTGPGGNYAVFFVVEKGERIQIITRRPDWYEVQTVNTSTSNRKIGWVKASQIARTLQATGEPADLPSISYGDYAKNRWRFGFIAGQISSKNLDGGDIFGGNIAYYPLSWLGGELEASRFFSSDVRGDQFNLAAIIEPFSQWRVSPALLIGIGTTEIKLQPAITRFDFDKESHNMFGLRLNYYVGRNFIVRAEYRNLAVPTNNNDEEFDIWNFGFSTLF